MFYWTVYYDDRGKRLMQKVASHGIVVFVPLQSTAFAIYLCSQLQSGEIKESAISFFRKKTFNGKFTPYFGANVAKKKDLQKAK